MVKKYVYQNGEIKVILDEQPMIMDYSCEWYQEQIHVKTFFAASSFLLGVELKVHRGGRVCYGMLAVHSAPNEEQDCVNISIAFTPNNTIKYSESILTNSRYVFKGLPKEFLERTIGGIRFAISEKKNFPQCNLTFKYAANCEIGSSPMLFGILAETIMDTIYSSCSPKASCVDVALLVEQIVKKFGLRC